MVGSCTFFQVISFTFIHVFTNWRISRSFQGAKGYNLKLPAPTSQNCHKTYDLLRLVRSNKDPHQAMQAIVINYSKKKKPNRWWLRTYFSKNTPGIFNFFLPLEIPDKTKLHPWKIHKIVLHVFEIPRPETKTPGTSTLFFLGYPWKFHFVFN